MNIAVLKNMVCINTAIFNNFELACQFFSDGAWPEADSIAALPEGFGIGDFYDGSVWTKKPEPEPEPRTSYEDLVQFYIHERYSVDNEIALINAAMAAISNGQCTPGEYFEYRDYVEECKKRVREETTE